MREGNKMEIVKKLSSVDDTILLAKAIASIVEISDIILFTGEIGTGKTTFIQAFAKSLGVQELVTSPSFVIQRVYNSGRIPLSHVDLYRLAQDVDIECIGFEEYYDSSVTVIEWADRYSKFEPPYLKMHFEYGATFDERIVTITPYGANWSERIKAVY